ncbi:MAG: hypothetical protein IJZ79_01955 [Bacilli bacterium]|nr:hypothetical protein [Bacilli bacterium]
MAEENKQNNTKPKKPKKKSKNGIDTPSLIFFGVMIIGLIVLTVIILTRPTSKIYSVQYGEDFIIHAELYSNNDIDLAIDVGTDRIVQSGTYKEIVDDDIEFNYTATFETEDGAEPVVVDLLIVEDVLTMTYDDGSEIILKESVK